MLEEPNLPIQHVYFPESGLTSVVAHTKHDRRIEVGLIGWEGMSGLSIVMGNDRSPNETFIQAAGSGNRILANDLRQAMLKSPPLWTSPLHYAQAFLATVMAADGLWPTVGRSWRTDLASWPLLIHGRFGGDAGPLAREFLALILAVRRPGGDRAAARP